jgi:putative ABC transport system permease protein
MKNLLHSKQRKGLSINILGLLLGISASIMILLFIKYEASYDTYHANFQDIYRIRYLSYKNGAIDMNSVFASPPMGNAIVNTFPEVKDFVRIFTVRDCIFEAEQNKFEISDVAYVDNSIFTIFTVPLISGNPEFCLEEPNTVALSESIANIFFGKENPIGKTLKLNNDQIFKVTGVYKDIPANSHFHFKLLMSYNTPNWLSSNHENTWDMFFTRTYLLIDRNADIPALEKKGTKLFNDHKQRSYAESHWEMQLQPLRKIHLESNYQGEIEQGGNGKMNNVLTVAAFLILIIAWLNYINLASAQSLNRAKEVGIRKVVGFSRAYLIRQFLTETLITNLIALIFSIVAVLLIKPFFSQMLDVDLSFKYWSLGFTLLLFMIFIFGTFLSGIYPAFILSSFNPIQTLKGKIGISAGGIGIRKVLLGFQFGISAILIFITSVIYFQAGLMLNKDLGIDIKNTLVLKGDNLNTGDSASIHTVEAFKSSLLSLPEIKDITGSNSLPANTSYIDDIHSDIQQVTEKSQFSTLLVDYNYFKTFNLEPIAGRVFSKDFPSDRNAVVITKNGVNKLGFDNMEDIINHKVNRDYGAKNTTVIGIIDEIQLKTWQAMSIPSIFYLSPAEKKYIAIKFNRKYNAETVNKIEKIWNEHFINELFRYFDLEESYKDLYKNEVRNSKLLAVFSFIAIFVACIGLWGLTQFTITHRTKEIGIRKILGFKVFDIVWLINKEFLTIVLIACLISIPIAWYLSYKWLENYATKIGLSWWMAIIPLLVVSLITVLIISYYTIRTAMADPVKAIKED